MKTKLLAFCIFAVTSAAQKPIATVSISDKPAQLVPPNYMGLSHEWNGVPAMMGSSQLGANLIYRQLVLNLEAFGSAPLVLRIGGNSTDHLKEPTPTFALPLAEVAKATGAHFIIGVNMGDNNPKLAADQAKAYIQQMPAGLVDAIELGNEPHLFVKNKFRPESYSPADYFNEYDKFKKVVDPALPAGIKLTGPVWGYQGTTWGGIPGNIEEFVKREGDSLSMITYHDYTSHPGANPPEDWLLKDRPATRGPIAIEPIAKLAHAHHLIFRMGETNSISNGGVHGISDAFGSALWAIDMSFEYITHGLDGINFISTTNNAYSAFYFDTQKSGSQQSYKLVSVNPLYYGLLFFQQAVGASAKGTHLLPIKLKSDANLKAWATLDGAHITRLALINKEETTAGNVAVAAPAGMTHAQVLRLMAPSFKSTTSGVTLAGQTFDGSTDGTIRGTQKSEAVTATNGIFQIAMPAVSAALIVFSK